MTKNLNIELDIVRLFRATPGRPLTGYALAKKMQRHINLIRYHLKKMEAGGIVVHGAKGYVLIPVLYDPLLVEALYAVLTSYVKDAAKKCESPSQLLSVLRIAIALFLEDLDTKDLHKKV